MRPYTKHIPCLRNPERVLADIEREINRIASATQLESANGSELDVLGGVDRDQSDRRELEMALTRGRDALHKHQRRRRLSEREELDLEAIVLLYGRPAIEIRGGTFQTPQEEWQILETHRRMIEKLIPGVGRIDVDGHHTHTWLGTAFRIGADCLLTNRHVAQEFADMSSGRFIDGIVPSIDMQHEHQQRKQGFSFRLRNPVRFHERYDAALLRIELVGNREMPIGLPVATAPPRNVKNRSVYVIGYPAYDSRCEAPAEMLRIFRSIFNVKRLQPGYTVGLSTGGTPVLYHDCSTLGGNSGSCVVDLDTHVVIGLHFGGKYFQRNSAVPIWELMKDGFLKGEKW